MGNLFVQKEPGAHSSVSKIYDFVSMLCPMFWWVSKVNWLFASLNVMVSRHWCRFQSQTDWWAFCVIPAQRLLVFAPSVPVHSKSLSKRKCYVEAEYHRTTPGQMMPHSWLRKWRSALAACKRGRIWYQRAFQAAQLTRYTSLWFVLLKVARAKNFTVWSRVHEEKRPA